MVKTRCKIILILYIILVCCMSVCPHVEYNNVVDRSKRQAIPLVFNYGGTAKFILGFGMPIKNPAEVPLAFVAAFQYIYQELANISLVTPYFTYDTISSRSVRDVEIVKKFSEQGKMERIFFYRSIENVITKIGEDGRSCVLRTICEIQQTPLKHDGLIGEIIQILFTPRYGNQRYEFDSSSEVDKELVDYISAQQAGEQLFHCPSLYSECPDITNILNIITQYEP